MEISMYRLIAFDMDGTLLDDNKRISQKTIDVLNRMAKKGVVLVPATGRPLCGVATDLNKIEGVRYVITCNGAGIYDWTTKTCLHSECMKLDSYLPMLEELDKLNVMADSFLEGEAYMTASKDVLLEQMNISEATKKYIRDSRRMVDNQIQALKARGSDVEKLTINFVLDERGDKVDLEQVEEILSRYKGINPVSGGMNNIEVTKEHVNKASGLQWIGGKLGISPEEMMAFGDSGNDVDMLNYVKLGVAMANGEDMAKEAADEIAASNEEDGVATTIEKYERLIGVDH